MVQDARYNALVILNKRKQSSGVGVLAMIVNGKGPIVYVKRQFQKQLNHQSLLIKYAKLFYPIRLANGRVPKLTMSIQNANSCARSCAKRLAS